MPLDLDYIKDLASKWRHYLLEKENPSFHENREEYVNRRRMYADTMDMIDEMKKETPTGVMLYHLFKAMESGNLQNYAKTFKK